MLTSTAWSVFNLLALALVASTTVSIAIRSSRATTPCGPPRATARPCRSGTDASAFEADVTGLQTFLPFAITSDWGWNNNSLPEGTTEADLEAYRGETWDAGTYLFGGPEPLQDWLTANPNRVNLGGVGLAFTDEAGGVVDVAENELEGTSQTLDLWMGTMTSSFRWQGKKVVVRTTAAHNSDVVGVTIASPLLEPGRWDIFLDFLWNDGSAFGGLEAPFCRVLERDEQAHDIAGCWRGPRGEHRGGHRAYDGEQQFFTAVDGDDFSIARVSADEHRYSILSNVSRSSFSLAIAYAPDTVKAIPMVSEVEMESERIWKDYWSENGFIDLVTRSSDARADELQRRIILSRYLMRVNEAGDTPPQEYGKFHMEMFFWHSAHWALWNTWDLLNRSSSTHARFLPTSVQRAQGQEGYATGARWPKMTDPSGRSSPGEINELLIWQQSHPLVFAEYEYRATSSAPHATLEKWREVMRATADWMAAYAKRKETKGFYDIGPPMYVVSEDTSPNVTRNAAFELAYWRFGLDHASTWMKRLGEEVPEAWTEIRNNLAPLPIEDGLYVVYEGIPSGFWDTPTYTTGHPALVGLYGRLPQTANVSLDLAKATVEKVWTS